MLFVSSFDIIIRESSGVVEKVLNILLEKVKMIKFLGIKKYKLFRFMGQNIKSFKHFKLYEENRTLIFARTSNNWEKSVHKIMDLVFIMLAVLDGINGSYIMIIENGIWNLYI